MYQRIAVICMAFILDIMLGDPVYRLHPIRLIGKLISAIDMRLRKILNINDHREEDKRKKFICGGLLVVLVLGVAGGLCFSALWIAQKLYWGIRLVVETIVCYQMLAIKSLKNESMKVYHALKEGDVQKARYAVSMIVGRDTERLDEKGIAKAAVETVAENTSDGIIAPMIYILLFGAVGGVIYKTINTMDSMIGYKNDKYVYMGRIAAKLDDIVNFVPARISAFLMMIAGKILGYRLSDGWKIFCRDRFKHASPNSAQTEAVCAGLLQVRLGGDAWYFGELHSKPEIGDDINDISYEHIAVVNKFAYVTALLLLVAGVALLFICNRFV